MSDWDDLEGVTQRISTEDTERMLSGGSGIDESPELADLAGVLNALRGPTDPTELTGLQSALGAFGAAIGGVRAVGATQSAPVAAMTRPMIRRRVTADGRASPSCRISPLAPAMFHLHIHVRPSTTASGRLSEQRTVFATDAVMPDVTIPADGGSRARSAARALCAGVRLRRVHGTAAACFL